MSTDEENTMKMKRMVIVYDQESGYEGTHLMHQMFTEGWETLEPLRFFACGHYCTTLYRYE